MTDPTLAAQIEALARIISPDAWARRNRFLEILRGEGRLPEDPKQIAMMKRSAERRKNLVVADSIEKASAIVTALRQADNEKDINK